MSPTFAALGIRNYRWYVSGQLVNATGAWMQRVAQDWLVLELTASPVAVGITTALQFLPFLLLAPISGALADRLPRRRLLVIAMTMSGLAAAVLALAVTTGTATVGLVYVLALLSGVAAALDNPARQAMVGEMVGRAHLANAVALNSAAFNLARIAGPSVAGLIIAASGTGPVFWLNAATSGFALVALGALRTGEFDRSQGRDVAAQPRLVDGLRYVREHPELVFVLLVAFLVATFGLNYQLTTVLMAQGEFRVGAAGFGLMGTVLAVGALVGSLGAARRRSRPRLRLVVGSALTFSALTLVAGLAPTYPVFLAVLPLVGATAMTFTTSAQGFLQLGSEPALRGRVMGLYTLVFFGGTPIGAPVIGWVAATLGPRWGLIGGGLLAGIGVLVTAVVALRRARVRPRAHLTPRPHLHLDPASVAP
jgi:MFS family permease